MTYFYTVEGTFEALGRLTMSSLIFETNDPTVTETEENDEEAPAPTEPEEDEDES